MAATSRPYKLWSADRNIKKSFSASSLAEFTRKAKEKLKVAPSERVTIVFEADGTEVDEEDYFQFLPFNTTLMLLRHGEKWREQCEEAVSDLKWTGSDFWRENRNGRYFVKLGVFKLEFKQLWIRHVQLTPWKFNYVLKHWSEKCYAFSHYTEDKELWGIVSTFEGHDEPDYVMPDGKEVSDRVRQLASGLKREITRLITFSNEDLQEMADMSTSVLAQLFGETEIYAKSVQEACQRHLDDRQQTSEAMELLKLYHKAREHSPYVEGADTTKRQKFAHT